MNHYERLKVSQDAPPEVIRAAYRALASKLHPDRQAGAETGPDDAMHHHMVALNGAYEVLIDPKLRQDYDASLAPSRPLHGASAFIPQEAAHPGAGSARVDMDWVVPQTAAPKPKWPPSNRTMTLGGMAGGVVVLAGVAWIWQEIGQHQIEQALSDQYAAQPASKPVSRVPSMPQLPSVRVASNQTRSADEVPVAESDVSQAPEAVPATRGSHRPTVAELSRMSDEELLRALPALDAPASASTKETARRTAAETNHLLDGKPLALRVDATLVDPLAAQPKH